MPTIHSRIIHIPDSLAKLNAALKEQGCDVLLVGGAVRDALSGNEPKDYDLATDKTPDQIIKALKPFKQYHVLEVGKQFGVITVVTPEGDEYQIATFRKDLSPGRRPESVEFTTVEFDASRRDLTINALYYNMTTHQVYDFVGGIYDLHNDIVRTVGNPKERFAEDRLRILRALRFGSKMFFMIHPATLEAITEDPSLDGVSTERIRMEFIAGLEQSRSPVAYMSLLDTECNNSFGHTVLMNMFPCFNEMQVGNWINSRDVVLQLFHLFEGNDPAETLAQLNKLSYSNSEIAKLGFWFDFRHLNEDNVVRLKRRAKALGITKNDLIWFGFYFAKGYPNLADKIIGAFHDFELTVKGEDLLALGYKNKELGQKMEELEKENFRKLLASKSS